MNIATEKAPEEKVARKDKSTERFTVKCYGNRLHSWRNRGLIEDEEFYCNFKTFTSSEIKAGFFSVPF